MSYDVNDDDNTYSQWSCANDLNLNLRKSVEIVFMERLRQCLVQLPGLMERIPSVSPINSHVSSLLQ